MPARGSERFGMATDETEVDCAEVSNDLEALWRRAREAIGRSGMERYRWLVPLVEALAKYPKARGLRPFTSHGILGLSETPSPYTCHRLPCARALREGWFQVYRLREKPRGLRFWMPVEHLRETVGEGDAETAAKLMDALIPAKFKS